MSAFLLCLLALAGAALGAAPDLRAQHHQELLAAKADPRGVFSAWMAKHGKGYANDLQASETRFQNWADNLKFALEYNARSTSHWVGLNSLADLSHEEYLRKFGLGSPRFKRAPAPSRVPGFDHGRQDEAALPASVDWRARGAVAEVKNQASCGSCWAFSTTGAIEGINALVTGELLSLSEQYLVDCDTEQDQGCQGGLMDYAFDFVTQHGGIELERDYPYTGEDGECSEEANRRMVTIDGYQDVPPMDEVALKKAASQQPVSVAIMASQRSFQLYVGGVFDDKECGTQLDHGVLVVGYGTDSGDELDADVAAGDNPRLLKMRNYWVVKNSWGPQWGDKGFIKMRMGRGHAGLCGIASQPSYPLKTGPNPPAPAPGPDPQPPAPPKPAPPKPKPSPDPVSCDDTHECPPDNTCCCLRELGGFCFTWGCCPMPGATCCPDKTHCCPSNLPVCDTDSGRCLPPAGRAAGVGAGSPLSAPWATKVHARRKAAPAGAGFGRKGGAARDARRFMQPEGGLPAAS